MGHLQNRFKILCHSLFYLSLLQACRLVSMWSPHVYAICVSSNVCSVVSTDSDAMVFLACFLRLPTGRAEHSPSASWAFSCPDLTTPCKLYPSVKPSRFSLRRSSWLVVRRVKVYLRPTSNHHYAFMIYFILILDFTNSSPLFLDSFSNFQRTRAHAILILHRTVREPNHYSVFSRGGFCCQMQLGLTIVLCLERAGYRVRWWWKREQNGNLRTPLHLSLPGAHRSHAAIWSTWWLLNHLYGVLLHLLPWGFVFDTDIPCGTFLWALPLRSNDTTTQQHRQVRNATDQTVLGVPTMAVESFEPSSSAFEPWKDHL